MISWNYENDDFSKAISEVKQIVFREYLNNGKKIHTFLGIYEKSGVTSIVCKLAQNIDKTENNIKILIVDANIRNHYNQSFFNIEKKLQVATIDGLNSNLSNSIFEVCKDTVYMLSISSAINKKCDIFSTNDIKELLSKTSSIFDIILIDSTPMFPVPDYALKFCSLSHSTYFIVEQSKVHQKVAQKAKELLLINGIKLDGVIINKIRREIPKLIYENI